MRENLCTIHHDDLPVEIPKILCRGMAIYTVPPVRKGRLA